MKKVRRKQTREEAQGKTDEKSRGGERRDERKGGCTPHYYRDIQRRESEPRQKGREIKL
jgi:hypothetical protein